MSEVSTFDFTFHAAITARYKGFQNHPTKQTLKRTMAVIAKMLENLLHLVWLIPKAKVIN
jgi:hypothetical protein